MITLEDLQQAGSIATTYQEVSFSRGVISISQLLSMPIGDQVDYDGAIVIDDCAWAATMQKIPITKAGVVYSANAKGELGCWRKKEHTFYTMEFSDGKLVTKKIEKVEKTVGEERQGGKRMDLSSLTSELEAVKGFDGGASVATAEAGATKIKADAKVTAIREKIGDGQVANRDDIIINNQKHGRALGFIVKTDPVIKVGVKKIAKLDAAGKKIPKAECDRATLDKFEQTGVIKQSMIETESSLEFSQVKPSKPVAMIFATPAGSDTSLTKVSSTEELKASGDTTKQVHIISMETAFSYLAFNYGGKIKEDDTLLGAKATWLRQVIRGAKEKVNAAGESEPGVVSSIVHEKKEGRSTLLTAGNYFPLKTYQTISVQDLSNEDAATLNLNIEAAMKKKQLSELSDASQKAIHLAADGESYESVWFNEGAPISVKKYDDKDATVTDVRLPRREKKKTKEGTGYTYKFLYNKIDDREHGPLSVKEYKAIIGLTGMSEDEFVRTVEGFGRINRAGKTKKDVLTTEDYLRAKMSHKVTADGTKSFLDLQKELEALA